MTGAPPYHDPPWHGAAGPAGGPVVGDSGPRPLRLFVGVQPPPEVTGACDGLIRKLRETIPDVNWTPRENLHATLKFLGSFPPERVPELVRTFWRVAREGRPLEARITGLGGFPSMRSPAVLWLGLEDSGALATLANAVETAAQGFGVEAEQRPFSAHLTIGRARRGGRIRDVDGKLAGFAFESAPFRIGSMMLYRSQLTPRGPIYTILESFSLG